MGFEPLPFGFFQADKPARCFIKIIAHAFIIKKLTGEVNKKLHMDTYQWKYVTSNSKTTHLHHIIRPHFLFLTYCFFDIDVYDQKTPEMNQVTINFFVKNFTHCAT